MKKSTVASSRFICKDGRRNGGARVSMPLRGARTVLGHGTVLDQLFVFLVTDCPPNPNPLRTRTPMSPPPVAQRLQPRRQRTPREPSSPSFSMTSRRTEHGIGLRPLERDAASLDTPRRMTLAPFSEGAMPRRRPEGTLVCTEAVSNSGTPAAFREALPRGHIEPARTPLLRSVPRSPLAQLVGPRLLFVPLPGGKSNRIFF